MDKEKTEVRTATTEIRDVEEASQVEADWQPGFSARFPWMGFGGLVFILLAMGGMITVLLVSDGKSQSQWPNRATPNVLLSVLNSIANICLGIAVANGVAIAWWRRALKGATVMDLHRSWYFSSSIASVVRNIKYFNVIAFTALVMKMSIIDSTLMQKAANTQILPDNPESVIVQGFSNTTFPITSLPNGRSQFVANYENWFLYEIKEWLSWGSDGSFAADQSHFKGCNGTCQASVEGVGFAFDCNTIKGNSDYSTLATQYYNFENQTSPEAESVYTAAQSLPLFNVTFDRAFGTDTDPDHLLMTTYSSYSTSDTPIQDGTCPALTAWTVCKLRPAIIEYPFIITNYTNEHIDNTIKIGTLQGDFNSWDGTTLQFKDFHIKSYINFTESITLTDGSRLAGLQQAFNDRYGSSANISLRAPPAGWVLEREGTYLATTEAYAPPPGGCDFSFADAAGLLLEDINQFMFYLSTTPPMDLLTAAILNTTDLTQGLEAIQIKDEIHFVTNRAYMYGAIASIIVCVLLVLPSYWGFWQLGRKVTLGPMEIANAFRSPILDHPTASNGVVDTLLKEVGDRKVQYGQMTVEPHGRLAVADPENVNSVVGKKLC